MENIINTANGTIIINGGNPLEGCPKDWDEAREIETAFNKGVEEGNPLWSFDCGFKLDYDGDIVSITSRFYPPTTHGGSSWNGNLTVSVFGKKVAKKEFDCQTLDQLHREVTGYVKYIKEKFTNISFP